MLKFLFLILLVIDPTMDPDWNFKKEKDGIQIYTRNVEGSAFEEFKGIVTIEKSSLTEILRVILDVKNYESLYPNCINPKILKEDGMYYSIQYVETKVSWPVKNRDSVFEQRTVIDENGKHARVTLKSLPDYIPENKDVVRIQKGSGFWELTEDIENKVKVIYQFHTEPAGEIPSWLANSFIIDQPFETLKNLKKIVE